MRHEYGLDLPILQQYWNYISGIIFHFDFGSQIRSGREITEVIGGAFPVTLRLALMAFAIEIVLGLGLGIVAGLKAGKLADNLVLILTLLIISMPVVRARLPRPVLLRPPARLDRPQRQRRRAMWSELLLPGIVLGSLSLAYVARLTRTSIAENLRADYMRTAVAKGLPRRRVIGVHLCATR